MNAKKRERMRGALERRKEDVKSHEVLVQLWKKERNNLLGRESPEQIKNYQDNCDGLVEKHERKRDIASRDVTNIQTKLGVLS